MESFKLNTPRASICLLLLILGSCFAGVFSNQACPVYDANFETESGVQGAIRDGPGNPNVIYYYPPGGWPNDILQCFRACKRWPSPRGVPLSAQNGEQGPCAYWVWMGGNGCYLFGCGVCRNFQSFVPASELPPPRSGTSYCSGGGPGRRQCVGGVKGDPHYTGGDRSHFEFTGLPGKNYCLFSDAHVQVNVFYDGRFDVWGNDTSKPLTWIRKVGILWGNHSLVMEARSGSEWKYEDGYMSRIIVDGRDIPLIKPGDKEITSDGEVEVVWSEAKQKSGDDEVDVYQVVLGDAFRMVAKLRPEVAHLRTKEDGVVHFTLTFPDVILSQNPHGVLGQTYRTDHKDRIAKHEVEFNDLLQVHVIKGDNAEGFLDGNVNDYEVSGLLKHDCTYSRFAYSHPEAMDWASGSVMGDDSESKIKLYRKLLR